MNVRTTNPGHDQSRSMWRCAGIRDRRGGDFADFDTLIMAADDSNWKATHDAVADLDFRNVLKLYAPLQGRRCRRQHRWTEATFCMALANHQLQPITGDAIVEAQRLYELVVAKSKDDRYIARAMLNIGRILELRNYKNDKINLVRAHDQYRKVLDRFPTAPVAAEAVLRGGAA